MKIITLMFVGAFFSAYVSADPIAERVGSLEFTPCELTLAGTSHTSKHACAVIRVPLHQDSPTLIDISVVRIKSKAKQAKADPLLMLAGGPGQAASEAYVLADRQFNKLNRDRDIYLVDQRGTGRSTAFTCPDDEFSLLDDSLDEDKLKAFTEKCLSAFPYDARYFSTSAAISDFEAVREALGIARWNLLGVSYGTRVALHYMRMHPDAVRSVVLDSVVYPEHRLGLMAALQSQLALERLLDRCEQDEACRTALPNLKSASQGLIESLRQQAVSVTFENFRTGEFVNQDFGIAQLGLALRLSLYQDETAAVLPVLLHEAAVNKNFAPLARKAAKMYEQMSDLIALGMHNSVVCTEDLPFPALSESEQAQTDKSYLGSELARGIEVMCSVWPSGLIDPDFKSPVKSDIPVLLLSGSEDPITPPEYADRAMVELSNARHLVLQGQGHHVSIVGCAPALVAKFVEELEPSALNIGCLNRVQAAPIFVDFNGPTP